MFTDPTTHFCFTPILGLFYTLLAASPLLLHLLHLLHAPHTLLMHPYTFVFFFFFFFFTFILS